MDNFSIFCVEQKRLLSTFLFVMVEIVDVLHKGYTQMKRIVSILCKLLDEPVDNFVDDSFTLLFFVLSFNMIVRIFQKDCYRKYRFMEWLLARTMKRN